MGYLKCLHNPANKDIFVPRRLYRRGWALPTPLTCLIQRWTCVVMNLAVDVQRGFIAVHRWCETVTERLFADSQYVSTRDGLYSIQAQADKLLDSLWLKVTHFLKMKHAWLNSAKNRDFALLWYNLWVFVCKNVNITFSCLPAWSWPPTTFEK